MENAEPGLQVQPPNSGSIRQDATQPRYWFPGNERYLFFPPFRINDQHNKTKSIGFALRFNRRGQVASTYLNIVFGSVRDAALISTHKKIVDRLGPFVESGTAYKYKRTYAHANPLDAFTEFLRVDYPRLREIIEQEKQTSAFFVSDEDFGLMLNRVNQFRSGETGVVQVVPPVEPSRDEDADEPRNLIWYGPPGTGKTYRLKQTMARPFRPRSDASGPVPAQL